MIKNTYLSHISQLTLERSILSLLLLKQEGERDNKWLLDFSTQYKRLASGVGTPGPLGISNGDYVPKSGLFVEIIRSLANVHEITKLI